MICDSNAKCAARATLSYDCCNNRDAQFHHLTKIHSDRFGDVALLGSNPRKSSWCIDQRNHRNSKFFAQPHQAQRLAVALRMRASEIAHYVLLGVASFLVRDNHAALRSEHGHTTWHGAIVGKSTVAM